MTPAVMAIVQAAVFVGAAIAAIAAIVWTVGSNIDRILSALRGEPTPLDETPADRWRRVHMQADRAASRETRR